VSNDTGRERRGLILARWALGVYRIALATGTHWPKLNITAPLGVNNDFLPGGADKWVHVLAFAGLCWLALVGRFRVGRFKTTWGVVGLLIIYAGVDELGQLLVVGRGVHFLDWVASSAGVVLGGVCWRVGARLGFWRGGDRSTTTDDDGPSFVVHAKVVMALTMLSRVFGLVRDRVMGVAIGMEQSMSIWVIAFMVPHLFRRLFGEGALSAAFIPYYTKLAKDDPARAGRFASIVVTALGLGLVAVTALVVAGMWLAQETGWVSGKWFDTLDLTTLTLWYAPMVCVVALLGGMLQTHRRFGPLAAAPIVLNVCIIGAALYYWLVKHDEWDDMQGLHAIGAGVLLAGGIQIVWQLAELWRERGGWFSLRDRPQQTVGSVRGEIRGLLRQWGPAVLGLAVLQINTLLDVLIAMFFSGPPGETMQLLGYTVEYPMWHGAAVLGNTTRLYELPLGVFGIAVATTIFPALAAASDTPERFAQLFRQGLRLTLFIGLPASLGLVLVRLPLATAIYGEGGALKPEDAARIAWVLLGYAPAVWAYSMNQVLTRAFFAHHNTTTPMRVSVAMVALNLTLNLILLWPLGAAGLAWSTAICATLQTLILLKLVKRYVPKPIDGAVKRGALQAAALTGVMGLVVGAFLAFFDIPNIGYLTVIAILLAATALGAAVVFVGARVLKMDELGWVLRRK
jgi:putative peptidoglycan lipid II flippase